MTAPGHTPHLVIPVHNRRATTLAGLRHLAATGELATHRVIVVDDGSTDGTAAAIAAEFPAIEVLAGTGELWWTGAIALGMRRALERGASHVIWLNDDTQPAPGALAALLAESLATGGLSGGVTFIPGETAPAYGGMRKTFFTLQRLADPGAATVRCDALHGNLVCIPAAVIRRLGFPDDRRVPHACGDFDYTLRAAAAGVPVTLVGRARAVAPANVSLNYRSWLLSDVPVAEWWRQLHRKGSQLNLRMLWTFHTRHWGVAGALHVAALLLRLTLISAIRLVVPPSLLRRLWGRRSAGWQHEQRHPPPS